MNSSAPLTRIARIWRQAKKADDASAYCMSLATVTARGKPQVRTILIKGIDAAGIHFVTQGLGAKGKLLASKPAVAATMHWPTLATQVCVEGKITRMPKAELETLWQQRDRDAQILYHAGIPQSQSVAAFRDLTKAVRKGRKQWQDHTEIPLSPHYVGYIIKPTMIEVLSSHAASRLNKRERYTLKRGEWACCIVAP